MAANLRDQENQALEGAKRSEEYARCQNEALAELERLHTDRDNFESMIDNETARLQQIAKQVNPSEPVYDWVHGCRLPLSLFLLFSY